MNGTNLEMEIRLELPETPDAEVEQRIRTRIEAELAALFPGTELTIHVQQGSWVLTVVLAIGIWVLDHTAAPWLKKRRERLADGGRQQNAMDDGEASSSQLQPPRAAQDFADFIHRPSDSFAPHGGELAKHLDNLVGADLPPGIVRSWTVTQLDKITGRKESYTYTLSRDEHSLTHDIKEPLPRREDPDDTMAPT